MSWIRLVCKTLHTEGMTLVFYLVNTGILILIFNLMLDQIVIAYPLIMSLVLLMVYLSYKTYAMYRFLDDLNAAQTAGILPRYTDHAKDWFVFSAISDIHKAYQDKLVTLNEKMSGRNTLFTSFIHNMKSSVTVIELAAGAHHADKLADIELENEKLKSNLEQALNILRLDEFANDYVPERIELHDLAASVINDRRRDFTGQNGRSPRNSATGIGLAMVKHIAKQLGHEVSLASSVGQGTCVSITFLIASEGFPVSMNGSI